MSLLNHTCINSIPASVLGPILWYKVSLQIHHWCPNHESAVKYKWAIIQRHGDVVRSVPLNHTQNRLNRLDECMNGHSSHRFNPTWNHSTLSSGTVPSFTPYVSHSTTQQWIPLLISGIVFCNYVTSSCPHANDPPRQVQSLHVLEPFQLEASDRAMSRNSEQISSPVAALHLG